MVKMVTIFGIVFFVCCTLSLTQGQSPRYEEYRRSILPHHGYEVLSDRSESDGSGPNEVAESQIDYTQFIG